MDTNTLVLILLLVLLIGGGWFGYTRWGWHGGWVGVLVFIVVAVILRALGVINFTFSV